MPTTKITVPQRYQDSSIKHDLCLRELSLPWHSGQKSLMKEAKFLALSRWHQRNGLADKGEKSILYVWHKCKQSENEDSAHRKARIGFSTKYQVMNPGLTAYTCKLSTGALRNDNRKFEASIGYKLNLIFKRAWAVYQRLYHWTKWHLPPQQPLTINGPLGTGEALWVSPTHIMKYRQSLTKTNKHK